jgi:hypothetical protein
MYTKTGFLALVVGLAFLFSACAFNKKPITTQEFTSKVTELGYTVHDVTEQMEGNTVASLVAIDKTESYKFEFHEVATKFQASNDFSQNKTTMDAIGGGSSASFDGNNWASFSKTTGGAYCYVTYIENTFIYARVPEEYKEAVKAVMKELGY